MVFLLKFQYPFLFESQENDNNCRIIKGKVYVLHFFMSVEADLLNSAQKWFNSFIESKWSQAG
jgi:hypothetical protein